MDKETILHTISRQKPRLIYVSGKTCTGKTTFANVLQQHGYSVVELDTVVMNSVVIPFRVATGDGFRTAYRDAGPTEQAQAFISAARTEITQRRDDSSLVVEGAIDKPRILHEIFSDELGDFMFIYFHPVHLDRYIERIVARFVAGGGGQTAGLPKDFWALVSEMDLANFKHTGVMNEGITSAITHYAEKSMEESKERLRGFQDTFPDVVVTEV